MWIYSLKLYKVFCRSSCYLHLLFFWLKFVPYYYFFFTMIFLFLNIPSNIVTVIRNPTFVEWCLRVRVLVFNATFNNISAISCRSVYLVEKTGVPKENHQPVASHWQSLLLVVIGTDCIGRSYPHPPQTQSYLNSLPL